MKSEFIVDFVQVTLMRRDKSRSNITGELIRQAVREAGLSLRELADQIGVSHPTIYAYVSGALRVPEARLAEIARIAGREIGWFIPAADVDEPVMSSEFAIEWIDALLGCPDPEKAITVALKAVATGVKDPTERAMLWQRVGNALTLLGRYLEAVTYLEQARAAYASAERWIDLSDCEQSLGYSYINLGELEKAERSFLDALKHAPQQTLWKSLISLAALAERRGEFEVAQARLDQIAEFDKLSDPVLTYLRANQASLTTTQGFWKESLAYNLQALKHAQKSGFQDQITERMIQVARAYLKLGQREQGSLWLVRALDAARMTQDTARETLARLVHASLYIRLNDFKTAREIAVQSLSIATRQQYRRSESYALQLLTEIALGRGDYEAARDYALQAISFGEAHAYYVDTCIAQIHLAKARLELDNSSEIQEDLERLLNDSKFQMLGEPMAYARSTLAQWQANHAEWQAAVEESRRSVQAAESAGATEFVIEESTRLAGYLRQSGDAEAAEQVAQAAAGQQRALDQQRVFLLREDEMGFKVNF